MSFFFMIFFPVGFKCSLRFWSLFFTLFLQNSKVILIAGCDYSHLSLLKQCFTLYFSQQYFLSPSLRRHLEQKFEYICMIHLINILSPIVIGPAENLDSSDVICLLFPFLNLMHKNISCALQY